MKEDSFNDLIIVKRSGQRVSFNGVKIAIAIKKAFESVYEKSKEKEINKVYETVLFRIEKEYSGRKTINVEDIQDIIEEELKSMKYIDVYESFKNYREKRALSRELYSEKEDHKFASNIEKLILTCENKDYDKPLDLIYKFGKRVSLDYSKFYLLESKYLRAHEEGKIFMHGLDFHSLGLLSSVHFDLSNMKINEENHLRDVRSLLLGLSREIYGEVSFPSIDYVLVQFVIDKFKTIYQKYLFNYLTFSGFIDYINILKLTEDISKMNFIPMNIDYCENYIKNDEIKSIFSKACTDAFEDFRIKLKDDIRVLLEELENSENKLNNNIFNISFGTNTTFEGRLISEILLEIIKESKDFEKIKFIYKIKKNVNYSENDINYYLYIEVIKLLSNKNIGISLIDSPLNKSNSPNKDYKSEVEYFSNGRRIYENVLQDKNISIGRMTLGTIGINLPLLGLKYRDKKMKEFYNELEEILELSKNALITSFEIKANRYKEHFKYLFNDNILIDYEKLEDKQKVRKIIKQGTFNIEIAGIKECVYALKQKNDISTIFEILQFIRKICNKYTSELKLNFNLSETTNEEVLKSFISINKSIYGNINNITDKEIYSKIFDNMDLPLNERLEYESKLQNLFNGGYITNINITKKNNREDITKLISLIKTFNIGFIKLTVGNNQKGGI